MYFDFLYNFCLKYLSFSEESRQVIITNEREENVVKQHN